jgi:hypothetical protein
LLIFFNNECLHLLFIDNFTKLLFSWNFRISNFAFYFFELFGKYIWVEFYFGADFSLFTTSLLLEMHIQLSNWYNDDRQIPSLLSIYPYDFRRWWQCCICRRQLPLLFSSQSVWLTTTLFFRLGLFILNLFWFTKLMTIYLFHY